MSPDRVDQLLRRASDDVRATIVRHAEPPPIELLDHRRHPVGRAAIGLVAITVMVTLGLAIVGDRSPSMAPPIDAPPPPSSLAQEAPPVAAGVDDLCTRVVGIADVLADPPNDTDVWAGLGDELDVVATRLDRTRSELDADTARRYDRFVALAGQAVVLGTQGGFTPARVRADDAVAVAAELVEFVARPGCELELPRSSDDKEPG